MGMNRQEQDRKESILRRREPPPEPVPPGITIEMLQDFGLVQGSSSPEEQLATQECARRAIAMLAPVAQRFIELRFYRDMTFEEMGDELALSPSAAYQVVQAAIRELRALIRSGKAESIAA